MADATDLQALQLELLTKANAALASDGSGAIDRALVSVGPPAWDCCPQLSVHLQTADKDLWSPNQAPGDRFHRLRGGSVNLVVMIVTAIRCVPGPSVNGQPPTAAALTASAAEVHKDGWALWNVLQQEMRQGTLFAGYPCRELAISPLLPVAPQGNCAGMALVVTTALGGYSSFAP